MDEEESGGEFEERRRDGRRFEPDRLSIGGRKRQLDDDHLDDSRCHPIAKQRLTAGDAAPASGHRLKCPQCVESFASAAHLIQHVQMAHPATLAYHAALAGAGKELADVPSMLHLANAAALAAAAAAANSSGRPANNLFAGLERDVTNADDEYKNEEDDPFSAVLREMKMKGEFPCRLCEAVFPNLRALKGKRRRRVILIDWERWTNGTRSLHDARSQPEPLDSRAVPVQHVPEHEPGQGRAHPAHAHAQRRAAVRVPRLPVRVHHQGQLRAPPAQPARQGGPRRRARLHRVPPERGLAGPALRRRRRLGPQRLGPQRLGLRARPEHRRARIDFGNSFHAHSV